MLKDEQSQWQSVDTVPLVSVIIPTHNRSKMLARAIHSVLGQSYARLEIIVVDDASTDDTPDVVKRFADPRVNYISHATNRGGAAARNTGIRAAHGEFIAFLDDDNTWTSDKTAEQLRAISGCDAVICTCDAIGDDLSKHGQNEIVKAEHLRRGEYTFGGTGVFMARSRVLKEIMFDETLPRYQDWDLFIRVALKYRVVYLNKPLVLAHSGEHLRITNGVLRVPLSGLEDQFRMVHKHRHFFGEKWFRFHMCRSLLWGIRHRADRLSVVAYTARHYGLGNVARVFARRLKDNLRTRSRDLSSNRGSEGTVAS